MVISIDMLAEDVLLTIFDQHLDETWEALPIKSGIETCQSLVHVSRQWRSIVFGSPHRLNLQLICTARTPARAMLDVWPALPLFIQSLVPTSVMDNMFAVLDCNNRIYQITLVDLTSSQLEQILAAMQVPFPRGHRSVFRGSGEVALLSGS